MGCTQSKHSERQRVIEFAYKTKLIDSKDSSVGEKIDLLIKFGFFSSRKQALGVNWGAQLDNSFNKLFAKIDTGRLEDLDYVKSLEFLTPMTDFYRSMNAFLKWVLYKLEATAEARKSRVTAKRLMYNLFSRS